MVEHVRLEEIAIENPASVAWPVPAWALGTVRRRSITFANGICDAKTQVYWVQSRGMTGDIRVHPKRPQLSASSKLTDLDLETLVYLASVEGGTATTSWANGIMSWSDWIGFQPYDKYPEPGELRRIGDCMVEFAPSGVYVEDWRFQQSERGLLSGLRLISETGHNGVTRPRQGGLVIAGDHAICAIARKEELPGDVRAQDFVRTSPDPVKALERVLDCNVDYAVRSSGDTFVIRLSTDPRREGISADIISGYSRVADSNLIQQTLMDHPGVRSRLWSIDSWQPNAAFPLATPAGTKEMSWLESESDTLIAPLFDTVRSAASCGS